MKIIEYTKDGRKERELTQQELEQFALWGSTEARQELLKQDISAATTDRAKITAILRYLGV